MGKEIMVIDKGGRGNAIAYAFARSPQVSKVYVTPGNAGSSTLEKCHQLPLLVESVEEEINAMRKYALEHNIDLAFVGPEGYLSAGIVDVFLDAGLDIVGPFQMATALESSKCDTKDFLKKIGVPIPEHENFDNPDEAKEYVKDFYSENPNENLVVKADGLAAGKGSIPCDSEVDTLSAVDELMILKKFGDAGNRVDIEKRLYGEELMFFVFTDGKTVKPLEAAQDYKRAFDDNDKINPRSFGGKNPNTGGMGGYSPHPWLDEELTEKIMKRIALPTITRFHEYESTTFGKLNDVKYKGIIYFGLMICKEGDQKNPYVLEINVRMGDPEAQVILPRLKTDFYDLSRAIVGGKLDEITFEWDPTHYLCACAVSGRIGRYEGYPGKHHTNQEILGLDKVDENCLVFHNGTAFDEAGQIYTTGGRVLTIVGQGNSLEEARKHTYDNLKKIRFRGMRYRRNIGKIVDGG
ncbi:MAG: phosphoribosylamine--glycine ligase [Promethearchaeota archaeon]